MKSCTRSFVKVSTAFQNILMYVSRKGMCPLSFLLHHNIYNVENLVCHFVFYLLSIGRRPTWFLCVFLMAAVTTGGAFAPTLAVFYTLYFLQGFTATGSSQTNSGIGESLDSEKIHFVALYVININYLILNKQISFKYFKKLCFIPKLFRKYQHIQTINIT